MQPSDESDHLPVQRLDGFHSSGPSMAVMPGAAFRLVKRDSGLTMTSLPPLSKDTGFTASRPGEKDCTAASLAIMAVVETGAASGPELRPLRASPTLERRTATRGEVGRRARSAASALVIKAPITPEGAFFLRPNVSRIRECTLEYVTPESAADGMAIVEPAPVRVRPVLKSHDESAALIGTSVRASVPLSFEDSDSAAVVQAFLAVVPEAVVFRAVAVVGCGWGPRQKRATCQWVARL